MNPAVQAILALTCVVVLGAAGLWLYQERQAHNEANSLDAQLEEFRESVDRYRETTRQLNR